MTINTNKILGIVFAIAILISILVLIYVNLPKQTDVISNEDTDTKTVPSIFSVIYDDEQKNFTLSELQQIESYTGKGGYRTQSGSINGVGNYTGINITTLVTMVQPALYRYSLLVSSEDNKTLMYNYTTIQGHITIYNADNASDPTPIGTGNMTMLLAFQYEGNWLDESNDGKLKIVFVDDKGAITQASLWCKKVTSIKIITE